MIKRMAWYWLLAAALSLVFSFASAQARPNFNISSVSFTPISGVRGCWGYVDSASQREFALICAGNRLEIREVTNSEGETSSPLPTINVTSTGVELKQVRPYSHYLFAVNQSGVGLQVIDVGNIVNNPASVVTVANFATASSNGGAHALHIDGHYAYLGMNGCFPQRWRIIDISNPLAPVEVGQFQTPNGGFNDSHDSFVRGDTAYVAFLGGGFSIVDITDRSAPSAIANVSYPGAFTHNCWTTGDGNYLFTTDEVPNGFIRVWDIRNPQTPVQIGSWSAGVSGSDVHNVQVQGNFLYASYYGEGVEVLDIEDPADPIEVGHFDTDPAGSGFAGCWDFFNFFPSGTLIASNYYGSTNPGMWVLKFNGTQAGRITGTVRSLADSSHLAGATIRFLDKPRQTQTDSLGGYSVRSEEGVRQLEFSRAGFFPETVMVTGILGDTVTVEVHLQPACSGTIRGDMNVDGNFSGTDVVLMLNCVFLGTGVCDLCFADVNCDGILTGPDVILELHRVFLGTVLPCP